MPFLTESPLVLAYIMGTLCSPFTSSNCKEICWAVVDRVDSVASAIPLACMLTPIISPVFPGDTVTGILTSSPGAILPVLLKLIVIIFTLPATSKHLPKMIRRKGHPIGYPNSIGELDFLIANPNGQEDMFTSEFR